MERHFVRELEALKTNLIKMSSLTEKAIAGSIRAFLERDNDTARRVIAEDALVNTLEVEIDEMVVRILALHQPVATDLRLILAALKINNDLERIGDHAVNIAESALKWEVLPALHVSTNITRMMTVTQTMLREAIDSFIHKDPSLARLVLRNDDEIDELNKTLVGEMLQLMHADQSSIEPALEFIRVSRNLERVADLATNIAEEVVFMAEAQIVKHHFASKARKP